MAGVSGTRGDIAEQPRPGELIRLVAEGLAFSGFAIRAPERDGGSVVIDCRWARCEVSVSDWGDVEWEWCPWASDEADPKRTADVTTALLTGWAEDRPRMGDGYGRDGLTFKGIVGRELKARGLEVALEVSADEDFFDVQAAIVVTSPASGRAAAVQVDDDGRVIWWRDFWPEAGTICWEPEYNGWIADPVKVADAVVDAITRAMSLLARPGSSGDAA